MMTQKPLRLKDYLELDCELGFQCASRRSDGAGFSTVRCLVDEELRRCSSGRDGRRLVRSRSVNALTKISAAFNAVKLLSFSSTSSMNFGSGYDTGVSLSRNLSKKIKGGFWKKNKKRAAAAQREEVVENRKVVKRVRDIVRLPSFDEDSVNPRRSFSLPPPVIDSCSGRCSEITAYNMSGSSPTSSFARSTNLDLAVSIAIASEVKAEVASNSGDLTPKENHTESSDGCQSEEEKDQLSPVSVMDFPFEEEDEDKEDDNSTAFHESLASIERTKMQLLQKIRRFESLAELVGPDDLPERFDEEESCQVTTWKQGSEEDDDDTGAKAWDLLDQLRNSCHEGVPDGAAEKLLFDFFIERLLSAGEADRSRSPLSDAVDWVNGNCHAVDDYWSCGEVALREMEHNGRWSCFEEEKKEIAAELEAALMGRLLEELMVDLESP